MSCYDDTSVTEGFLSLWSQRLKNEANTIEQRFTNDRQARAHFAADGDREGRDRAEGRDQGGLTDWYGRPSVGSSQREATLDMGNQERRAAYASLWVLSLAFGWIEGSVVVYLREISVREMSLQGTNYFAGLPVWLVSLPSRLVAVEMAREACTILLLAAVAWLAGRRAADRAGAFLLSFGIWDLTYYAVLRLVHGWPESLGAWDILFLIPLPWIAPVWAPVAVATLFVVAGSYLFWTSELERRYRWSDVGVLAASALLTIAALLTEWRAAADQRMPEQFPVWLFWAGVALGTAWFVRVERGAAKADTREPWLGVRVRSILPGHPKGTAEPNGTAIGGAVSREHEDADLGRVISEHADAKRRLDALVPEAAALGEVSRDSRTACPRTRGG